MLHTRKMPFSDELHEPLGSKVYKWKGSEMGHNTMFSLADYDYPDKHLLRSFCTAPAIPWSAFRPIQGNSASLNEKYSNYKMESPDKESRDKNDESNATNAKKMGDQNDVAEPLKSFTRFFEELCPDLCTKASDTLYRGATELMLAVVLGDNELARRCLDLKADPNNMSFLSDPGVAVNQMQHGYSPMFIAVIAGRLDSMKLLREFGGSIDVYDRWGRTPLHAALAIGTPGVVEWLLSEGAPRCIGSCITMSPDGSTYPEVALPIFALHKRPEPPSSNSEEETVLCHCPLKRPKGRCGCVDDMFLRWSYDRLQTRWLSGIDLSAVAASYTSNDRAPSYAR